MTPADLSAMIDATWPPVEIRLVGEITLRRGNGGGQRVSAATVQGPVTVDALNRAEAAMRAWGQSPLFMVRRGENALDAVLAQRGYVMGDRVSVWTGTTAAAAQTDIPCNALHEPGPEMRHIWARGGLARAGWPRWPVSARPRHTWLPG